MEESPVKQALQYQVCVENYWGRVRTLTQRGAAHAAGREDAAAHRGFAGHVVRWHRWKGSPAGISLEGKSSRPEST